MRQPIRRKDHQQGDHERKMKNSALAPERLSVLPEPMGSGWPMNLPTQFRMPLVRNGYSLVANVGLTSVLGLIYWVLAARLYAPEDVGLNAALISAMTVLSGFGQLNLGSVLTRFLPTAGTKASQWIISAYGLATILAALSSSVFLLGVRAWMPSLEFVVANSGLAAWFIIGTTLWTVFVLQDGALAGLRRAVWIPIENTFFGLAKIALLVVFATTSLHAIGLFASWTVPVILIVIATNVLMFRVILPLGKDQGDRAQSAIDVRAVARFFGGDYLGTVFFYATIGAAPILVLAKVGAAGNAQYYLAWTIAYSLYLVSKAVTVSLVAEEAADRSNLNRLATHALVHTMGLLAVAVAVVLAVAPVILALFGTAYVEQGPMLLQILALSALPFGLTSIYLGVARVEGRMIFVASTQGVMMVLVLGLGSEFLDLFGTIGIGFAWLLAQTAIASVLFILAMRKFGGRLRLANSTR
jgi:hypothetical protein